MTFLLDVNVLIALLDRDHVFHERAIDWFELIAGTGWATCPLTQNGVLRILGSPRYPAGPGSPAIAAHLLASLAAYGDHRFWADDLSIISSSLVDPSALGSSAHVTDTYLLALAAGREGKLASFDRRLSTAAVKEGERSLHVIG